MSLTGKPCIHIVWRVPKADEAEIDAYWKSHEEFMRASHKMGMAGDDSETPRLLEFYISKGMELNNPLDPASGETGNLLYIMSETYAAPEGIAKHMALGTANWPGMGKIGDYGAKYGVFTEVGATSVFTCLEDKPEPMATAKGEPCIHIVWRVPKADEAEVDAYWKSHEEWMRSSHAMGVTSMADDSVKPRLTSFYISKGMELNNPMDPASGETGNILYVMAETYAAPEGIAKHMALGTADWPGMAKIGDYGAKYGVFMEAGATSVFTNIAD